MLSKPGRPLTFSKELTWPGYTDSISSMNSHTGFQQLLFSTSLSQSYHPHPHHYYGDGNFTGWEWLKRTCLSWKFWVVWGAGREVSTRQVKFTHSANILWPLTPTPILLSERLMMGTRKVTKTSTEGWGNEGQINVAWIISLSLHLWFWRFIILKERVFRPSLSPKVASDLYLHTFVYADLTVKHFLLYGMESGLKPAWMPSAFRSCL